MKLSTKIYLIIGGFVVLFLGVVWWFMETGIQKDIEFAEHEIEGDAYLAPLHSLLTRAGEHQLLTQRILHGDSAAPALRSAVAKGISDDLDKVQDADKLYSASLRTSLKELSSVDRSGAYIGNLKKEWDSLRTSSESPSADKYRDEHVAFIGHIAQAIENAGDTSELILDPDLDTYYVMSIVVQDIVTFQTRLTEATANALEVSAGAGQKSSKELDVSIAILKGIGLQNVIDHTEKAIKYDKEDKKKIGVSQSLERNLSAAVASLKASTNDLEKTLTAISEGKRSDGDVKGLTALEARTRNEAMAAWSVSVKEMDDMLNTRVKFMRAEERNGLLIAAVAIIAAVLLSFFILRTTTRAIETVSSELSDLAAGEANLSRRLRVRSSDEVGVLSGSFNKVMDKMLGLVRQVQQSGAQVTSSSTQIAASTKQLQAAVSEQAASTNEIVATTKEISVTSQNLVKTMSEVAKMASDTAELAGSGRTNLEGMEATIRGLADATSSISFKLSVISEKASNINKIVTTISKVADQTNLLSLNASIEAEKAGEHGLGFAVVAREIRRLADQTAVSTLDIERMVTEMRSAVTTGVMEMDKFTKDVSSGVDEVNKIGGQLTRIMERVQALAPRFETVTDGMQAQSQGAQQINEAMMHLSDAAKQTMDALRQTNGAIAELNEAARGLHHEVSRFRTVSGESTVEHVGLHESHAA